jgi:hypothetical protein
MRALVILLLSLLCVGCDELDKEGKLENGEFEYECGGPGDAACSGTEAIFGIDLDRDILPIAVGGSFNVHFDEGDTDVIPASPELLAGDGATIRFVSPVTIDFLAVNQEGQVRDFVDLSGVQPTGLQIYYDGEPVSHIDDPIGTVELGAAPIAGSEVLGGGFSYTWSSTGDITMLDSDNDNVVEVSVYGTATVTVTSNGMSSIVTFQ